MTTETYRRNCKDTTRTAEGQMEFPKVIDVWEESGGQRTVSGLQFRIFVFEIVGWGWTFCRISQ